MEQITEPVKETQRIILQKGGFITGRDFVQSVVEQIALDKDRVVEIRHNQSGKIAVWANMPFETENGKYYKPKEK